MGGHNRVHRLAEWRMRGSAGARINLRMNLRSIRSAAPALGGCTWARGCAGINYKLAPRGQVVHLQSAPQREGRIYERGERATVDTRTEINVEKKDGASFNPCNEILATKHCHLHNPTTITPWMMVSVIITTTTVAPAVASVVILTTVVTPPTIVLTS